MRNRSLLVLLLLAMAASAAVCQDASPARGAWNEEQLYADAARRAWAFVDRNYHPATGLVRAHDGYPYVTLWDVASGVMAHYSANQLGLLPDSVYDARMRRALRTLREMPFYRGAAFGRVYSAETGGMVDRALRPTREGYGWSATDLGRLLVVLRVVASKQPRFAEEARAVVERIDSARVVEGGYLWGEDVTARGRTRRFREGRIGYEQYAAQGFTVWDMRPEKALHVAYNATPVTVLGVELLADRRRDNRLTSEPFLLMGLETGFWEPQARDLARAVLAAQEARWKETGQVTMASEDALSDPPYYFYYYNVYGDAGPFSVDAAGPMRGVRAPRWVSTKAAFAWHALFPGPYTRRALETVVDAHQGARDWRSGLYEGTGKFAGPANVNTSAVILEAALYRRLGHPLLASGGAGTGGGDSETPTSDDQ